MLTKRFAAGACAPRWRALSRPSVAVSLMIPRASFDRLGHRGSGAQIAPKAIAGCHPPPSGGSEPARRAARAASAMSARMARARGSNVAPDGRRRTPREVRSNSFTPSSSSSERIWRLSGGWDRCKRAAARPTFPSSATATKYSSCARLTAGKASTQATARPTAHPARSKRYWIAEGAGLQSSSDGDRDPRGRRSCGDAAGWTRRRGHAGDGRGANRPGLSTADIDAWVRADTARCGGRPSQLGFHGFPAAVCTSRNAVVCHGIPSPQERLAPGRHHQRRRHDRAGRFSRRHVGDVLRRRAQRRGETRRRDRPPLSRRGDRRGPRRRAPWRHRRSHRGAGGARGLQRGARARRARNRPAACTHRRRSSTSAHAGWACACARAWPSPSSR